ncbi:hypothetical protein [Bacillus subtilis]|uniref:hypothetical protein n=1 Tax=Bacillus subtilis TaxID=1423 RepID=UPI00227E1632|nr:hypothetical protein [Bacillus subtilis]MCY8207390.1 hypothetical protein [Bacillus subtilis]
MAKQFQYTKNIVAKALLELEHQYVVYAKPKSGYYVVNSFQTPSPNKDHIDFLSTCPENALCLMETTLYESSDRSLYIVSNRGFNLKKRAYKIFTGDTSTHET